MAMSASSSASGLTREEGLALLVALAAHVALIGALTLSPPGKSIMAPPERMTVTFADQIADQSTSPEPDAQAAPDVAPVLGEPVPEPAPPEPAPVVQPQPQPKPAPPTPIPQARPQPLPKPVPKSAPQPRVGPAPPPKPVAKPAPPKPAAAAPADARQRRRPDAPSGASRLGSDFLKGIPTGTKPGATGNPANAVSAQAKAAIRVSINMKVLPPWNSCPVNGVDIEKLRVRITFQLDRGGNVIGIATPELSGQTPANAAQAGRFSECAIRAVRTAAPFNLPADSYEFWKNYTLNFRKE
jgi:outer membrane biosynthesis protein TonB